MRADYVDIWNEVLEVEREVDHLAVALRRTTARLFDGQDIWERTQMLGSGSEKVYTGCERIMNRIAAIVDGVKISRTDGWHATLLLRMSHPFPEVREAILSADAYALLDKLRSFRHRERNTYGFNLDLSIVQERAQEAVQAFGLFKMDVKRFLDSPSRHA